MRNIKGISLITLVITIIVIIIISTAVILTVTNNIGEPAARARFMNDIRNVEDAISLYKTSKYANSQSENINPIDIDKGISGIVDVTTLSDGLVSHMEEVFDTTIDTKQGKLYYVKMSDLNLNISSAPAKEGGYITKNSSIIQDMDTGKVFYEEGQDIGSKRWYSIYGGAEVAREEILPTLQMEATPAQEPDTGATTEVNVKMLANNANRIEYSLDGESYSLYEGSFRVYDNGTVYGRALNEVGEATDQLDIVNIKKEPDVEIVANPEQKIENKPSGNVTVTINTRSADVVQYSFDGETYTPYNAPFIVNTNGTIYAKAINTYGESEATIEIITIGDEPPVVIASKWDNENEGNEPLLTKGENSTQKILKPMEWVGNEWKEVTDLDKVWYSYSTDSQYWANAQSADGSMWVWIPRFAYKITSGVHSNTAGTVDIKFIQGDADAPSGYTLASAFEVEPKVGEKLHLQGIWVAKFEASKLSYKDANNKTKYRIQVKPGVVSWRSIRMRDAFNYCVNMKTDSAYGFGTDGISVDTHLIKNGEWDAITYLTQSKYGTKGQEVWLNNDYYFKTGRAGKTVSSKYGGIVNTNTYTYDNAKYGVNASTTKNVYGIYDMSGGAKEMTASYVNNNHRFIKYSGGVYSGLEKYFDKYPSSQLDKDYAAKSPNSTVRLSISNQNYQLLSGLNDSSVYNTSSSTDYRFLSTQVNSYSSWFSDYSIYPQNSSPFIARGGSRPGSTENPKVGIYAYEGYTGYASSGVGFRPVLSIKEEIEIMPDKVAEPSIYVTSKIAEEGTDIEFPEYEDTSTVLKTGEKVVIAYPKEAEYMYYKKWTSTAEPSTWTLINNSDANLVFDEASGMYLYSITYIPRSTKFKAYCSKGPAATDSEEDYLEVMYDTTKPGVVITGPNKSGIKPGESVTYTIVFSDNTNELNEAILNESDLYDKIIVKAGTSIISEDEITKVVEADANDISKWNVTLNVDSGVTRNISGVKIEVQAGAAEDLSGNKSNLKSSSSFSVDKAAPTVSFSPNGGLDKPLSSRVTVSDTGGSGVDPNSLQYIWSASESEPTSGWNTFTSGALITGSASVSQYLWIKCSDKAGNTTVTQSNLFEMDTTPPNSPTMVANPVGWTNGNVSVTITYPSDTKVKEYSLNGTTWSNYASAIVVNTNGTTVYARGKDASGNISEASTITITNIDRTAPTITFGTNGGVDMETASTTVNVTDVGGGVNASTLQYIWDTQNLSAPTSGWTSFTNGATLTKSNYTTIYLWVKATDNAGNSVTIVSNMFKALEVPSANKPVLAPGMTAVNWNGSSWVAVANPDTNTTWYNYDGKQWANAMTADGSMWVWIPRYIYKITSGWHTQYASEIQIQFTRDTNDDWNSSKIGLIDRSPGASASNNKWTNHPAFTFGSTEVKGIWVAKFEAGGSTSAVDVKPNVSVLRILTIDSMFTACRIMETNSRYGWGTSGAGIDTHMMKNIEFGAAMYLSSSKYGKNGEVWVNPLNSFLTGYSGKAANSGSLGIASTYPYYDTTYGVNAGTTGNVYGIFDFSGCTWERLAAYIDNNNANLTTYGASLYYADPKYKDVYTKATSESIVNNYNLAASNKKGDAVYETSNVGNGGSSGHNQWYGGLSNMPYSSSPFFMRGDYNGAGYSGSSYGAYSLYQTTGTSSGDIGKYQGFRPVLIVADGI
ncbi:MAG: hypothetical protein N2749_05210 [Clostridia bacterium]|nr:hypothetical protein [Clostridia bacterium]